jgi:hypothetical protein
VFFAISTFCLFVCLQYEKQSNLETKTCTLIWDTDPMSPPSFSSIRFYTAEKLQIFVRPNAPTNKDESRRAGQTIVR